MKSWLFFFLLVLLTLPQTGFAKLNESKLKEYAFPNLEHTNFSQWNYKVFARPYKNKGDARPFALIRREVFKKKNPSKKELRSYNREKTARLKDFMPQRILIDFKQAGLTDDRAVMYAERMYADKSFGGKHKGESARVFAELFDPLKKEQIQKLRDDINEELDKHPKQKNTKTYLKKLRDAADVAIAMQDDSFVPPTGKDKKSLFRKQFAKAYKTVLEDKKKYEDKLEAAAEGDLFAKALLRSDYRDTAPAYLKHLPEKDASKFVNAVGWKDKKGAFLKLKLNAPGKQGTFKLRLGKTDKEIHENLQNFDKVYDLSNYALSTSSAKSTKVISAKRKGRKNRKSASASISSELTQALKKAFISNKGKKKKPRKVDSVSNLASSGASLVRSQNCYSCHGTGSAPSVDKMMSSLKSKSTSSLKRRFDRSSAMGELGLRRSDVRALKAWANGQ